MQLTEIIGQIEVLGPYRIGPGGSHMYDYIRFLDERNQSRFIKNVYAPAEIASFLTPGMGGEFYFIRRGHDDVMFALSMGGQILAEKINVMASAVAQRRLILILGTIFMLSVAYVIAWHVAYRRTGDIPQLHFLSDFPLFIVLAVAAAGLVYYLITRLAQLMVSPAVHLRAFVSGGAQSVSSVPAPKRLNGLAVAAAGALLLLAGGYAVVRYPMYLFASRTSKVRMLVEAKEFGEANSVAARCTDPAERAHCYYTIAHHLSGGGNGEKEAVIECFKASKLIPDKKEKTELLYDLVDLQIEVGEISSTSESAAIIARDGQRPDAEVHLFNIVCAQANAKDFERAEATTQLITGPEKISAKGMIEMTRRSSHR